MTREDATHLVHQRYQLLSPISRGGMGVVWRALDRLTGAVVALKRIHLACTGERAPDEAAPVEAQRAHLALASTMALSPSALALTHPLGGNIPRGRMDPEAFRRALAQEFRTLASLRHPHIISVLDYGFDLERQPYFTMELLEGAHPLDLAGHDLPTRITLVLQVLQALTYLHRRGVLHRDIKPANILVVAGAAGPEVKLIDFGLALLRGSGLEHAGAVYGTVGYIAPEVMQGEPVSEAADLYSVGVVACELLTGRSPLVAASAALPLSEHGGIDVRRLDLPAPLIAVLERMLAQDPAQRYPSSAEAAAALAAAAQVELPDESATIRESFLQAAEFVGREGELAELSAALAVAVEGRGSAWLVGGESGVGKSRLLDELRIMALVGGVRVLRGQAQPDGTSGLALLADALRTLALLEPLDALEASVINGLVPDLPALLGRSVPEPPALAPQAARLRLMSLVEGLLLRVSQPTLLLVEDLHWIDADSLELLQRLVPELERHALLVVGTYRDDERPELPEHLPAARHLGLGRLGREAIVRLSTSMLGAAGKSPALVELLHAETEGNTYFIIEVVRAWAEESGSLAAIGQGPLPRSVLVGGMQAVVERRLGRVPAQARPLLEVAAVAGRKLDLRVLAALEPALDAWLRTCTSAGVLEVSEESWRFAHDKLREGLLAALPDEARRAIHRRLADVLHELHGAAPEHAAVLAYHYDQAGAFDAAARHAARAGAWAVRHGAPGEAVALLEHAAELAQRLGWPPRERALLLADLARAFHGLGRIEECIAVALRVMTLLEQPLPTAPWERRLALLGGLGQELGQRLGLPRGPFASHVRETDRQVLELLSSVGDAFFMAPGRTEEALLVTLRCLRLAEMLGDLPSRTVMLAGLGGITFLLGLRPLGRLYLERARSLAERVEEPQPRATVHRLWGLLHCAEGDWSAALGEFERFGALGRAMGDASQEAVAGIAATLTWLLTGRWADARRSAEAAVLLAQRAGNPQYQAIALALSGLLELRQGRLTEGGALLGAAQAQVERSSNEVYLLCVAAFRALHALLSGDGQAALALAAGTPERMARIRAPTPAILESYHALLSVWAYGLERARGPEERARLRAQMEYTLGRLRHLTRAFPIARARALLWEGRLALLGGRPAQALVRLRASLRAAQALGMPYDLGLAHLWLGQASVHPGGRRARPEETAHRSLLRAVEHFRSLGAWHELAEVEALLARR